LDLIIEVVFIQKKMKEILRVLAAVIDLFIIMLPVQFIMIGVFQVSDRQAEFFFCVLSAVYGTLAVEYTNMTLGKYFGKLRVVDNSGGTLSILYVGLRELTKAMYFIPYIGWFIGVLSAFMMFIRQDKRALHDIIGNTKVVYDRQYEQDLNEREEHHG